MAGRRRRHPVLIVTGQATSTFLHTVGDDRDPGNRFARVTLQARFGGDPPVQDRSRLQCPLVMAGQAAVFFCYRMRDHGYLGNRYRFVTARARTGRDPLMRSRCWARSSLLVTEEAVQRLYTVGVRRRIRHPRRCRLCPANRRVTAGTLGPEMRPLWRLVTGRTVLQFWFTHALVTFVTRRSCVCIHELDWVLKVSELRWLGPLLAVTDPVRAKARVVRTILDRPVAVCTRSLYQETVFPDKVRLAVRVWLGHV